MSIFDDPVMLHREIQRIGSTGTGRRVFSKDKLAESPAPDPYIAEEEDTGLSHSDLDAVEDELAAKYGQLKVHDMICLAHGQATLGRGVNERSVVLAEVTQALRRGQSQVPEHTAAGLRDEMVRLSAARAGTVIGSVKDEASRLFADHEDVIGLTISAERRQVLAKRGHALPDGSFPVHDAHHVGLAKAAYKAGKLAGHDKAEVKAHINRNAKRLGMLPLDDDDDGDEKAAMTVSLSAGTQELARQAKLSGDSADAIAARHAEFFG
jgi:hypothetical protein